MLGGLNKRFGCAVLLLTRLVPAAAFQPTAKPNIVFVFTDDQDYRHGSLDYQPSIQQHLAAKGTTFTNHYATVSVCCPSRVSLMRGQAAHNTNNTAIKAPGGGYPKFVASGEDEDYLPHWLVKAGYQANYIGKLYNGNSLLNYNPAPKGWSHIDVILEPYLNEFNTVVMSENGERPRYYKGFQQADVLRIKADTLGLEQLEKLNEKGDPFFLMIAPTAPHVQNLTDPPVPPARYLDTLSDVQVPRTPNCNPADEYQKVKPSWLKSLDLLDETQIREVDLLYQRRLESLRGVDDIVENVVQFLEEKGLADNTYIIYSADQGYHLGTHRHVGKQTGYLEDTNIPLVVRGPGVPKGVISDTPSTVTDFAPTFLEIAGVAAPDQPCFLDGASLLSAWKNPNSTELAKAKEAINIEFWGDVYTELPTWYGGVYAPYFPGLYLNNSYKTMRVVGRAYNWVYSRWCTNETELYDVLNDPYELNNLANSTDLEIQRVMTRLNALLLVGKSCVGDTCRHPWGVLQPSNNPRGAMVTTLEDALDPRYDDFYASLPTVKIDECMEYQFAANEFPFYPVGAEHGLGLEYRDPTDNYVAQTSSPKVSLPTGENAVKGGGWDQRHASYEDLLANSRELTDDEINNAE